MADSENWKDYEKQLVELKGLITHMPNGVPDGLPTGPITTYFGDAPVIDPSEGPYMCLNQAWDRVFQCSDDEKAALVVKGPYGLGCVVRFVEAIAASPSIRANNVIFLVTLRLRQLSEFLKEEYKKYPAPSGGFWHGFDGVNQ